MKILMKETVQGSLDGLTVQELVAGTEYSTVDSPRGERLAKYHVRQGVAVLAPVTVLKAISLKRPSKQGVK